jgi:hypothetical protein
MREMLIPNVERIISVSISKKVTDIVLEMKTVNKMTKLLLHKGEELGVSECHSNVEAY